MLYEDLIASDDLSIEAQVALLRGDEDAEDFAAEASPYICNGTRAKSFEKDRLTFDDAPQQPNSVWEH